MQEVRLIDANALIQNHCGACTNKDFCAEESCPYYEIRRRIEAAPTVDAVPVVRCGECKYMLPCGRCTMFADDKIRPSVSDFCSHGERGEAR